MPLQLASALTRLQERGVLGGLWDVEHPTALDLYFSFCHGWYRQGFRISEPLLVEVASLTTKPEYRKGLERLVGFYPSRSLRRVFRRYAQGGAVEGDFSSWLSEFPDLRPDIADAVIERARRFNRDDADTYCLIWWRYLDGGDEAARQLACTIKRSDRRSKRSPRFSYLRHDLETHGTITTAEAARINHWLAEIGGDPLDHLGEPRRWWMRSHYEQWCTPRELGLTLALSALASFGLGEWTDLDVDAYATALSRLQDPAETTFCVEAARHSVTPEAWAVLHDSAPVLSIIRDKWSRGHC